MAGATAPATKLIPIVIGILDNIQWVFPLISINALISILLFNAPVEYDRSKQCRH